MMLAARACNQVVELVTEYLEHTLPTLERARFEAHLDGCPPCHVYLAQVRQTVRWLAQLPREPIAPGTRGSLRALFRGWRQGAL